MCCCAASRMSFWFESTERENGRSMSWNYERSTEMVTSRLNMAITVDALNLRGPAEEMVTSRLNMASTGRPG